ncbi:hypothetical protein [Peribacillus asahii]|uniref:hypothetical protein n=1 Tax=Peribacillus asahii TaxID=228899 RepID=UPI0037F775A8
MSILAEIAPKLTSIVPFDALRGTSIYFTYFGSKQAVQNELLIREKDTGLAVYSFSQTGLEKVHHVPPAVVENGKTYTGKLRVKFLDGTYSPYSNEVEFHVIATPILDIESVDGQGYVYNSDVTFVARYTQAHGEKVKTYRFHLYDENEDMIKSFPLRTPEDEAELTETVTGLEKGKGYFIECVIQTVRGFTWSQKEKFVPLYLIPSINGLVQTRSDNEEGFIRVTANLKQLLGTQVRVTDPNDTYISDNYEYEDEDWIIVPDGNPLVFKGLGMNRASDFVMKVWCKNVPIDTKFLELSPPQGEGIPIELWRYHDRIVAVKRYAGAKSVYCSNIIEMPEEREFMLYVKVIEHRIQLTITIL